MKKVRIVVALLLIFLFINVPALCANAVPQVVLTASKSVVRIVAAFRNGYSSGSGFVVKSDDQGSFIVTNRHVITSDNSTSDEVYIVLGTTDDDLIPVTIVAQSEEKDLCMLRAENDIGKQSISIQTEDFKQGDAVYAVGFPGAADAISDTFSFSSDSATITDGIISAIRQTTITDGYEPISLVQVTAPVNEGNSGGPLFNEFGSVIGIITLGVENSQGIYGAVSSTELQDFANQLGITLQKSSALQESHGFHLNTSIFLYGLYIGIGLIVLFVLIMLIKKGGRRFGKICRTVLLTICNLVSISVLLYSALYGWSMKLTKDAEYSKAETILKYLPASSKINKDYSDYIKAGVLLQEGNVEEAAGIYHSLDGYRDSESLASEARYLYADSLVTDHKYEEAIQIYNELGEYKDSAAKITDVKFKKALYLTEQAQYEEAQQLLYDLKKLPYDGVEEAWNELQWQWGLALIDECKLDEGYKRLCDVVQSDPNYDTKLTQLYSEWYEIATDYYNRSNYKEAEKWFDIIPSSYENTALYKAVCHVHTLDKHPIHRMLYSQDAQALLNACDNPNIKKLIQSEIYIYLYGDWQTKDADYKLSVNQLDTFSTNLPSSRHSNTYSLEWSQYDRDKGWYYNSSGTIIEYYYNKSGNSENIDIFKITIINTNEMSVYCYKNGQTYTMYRVA